MWKTASILVTIVLVLITLGVVMLASTSSIQGDQLFKDPNYFLKRQLLWLVVGFLAAFLTSAAEFRRPLG